MNVLPWRYRILVTLALLSLLVLRTSGVPIPGTDKAVACGRSSCHILPREPLGQFIWRGVGEPIPCERGMPLFCGYRKGTYIPKEPVNRQQAATAPSISSRKLVEPQP